MASKIFKVSFTPRAANQINKIKDKKTLIKLRQILQNMTVNPYTKEHKFERLKGDKSGLCSLRLSKKDRLVYKVEDKEITVLIISVKGHYDDN